jgi:hypothetical protein
VTDFFFLLDLLGTPRAPNLAVSYFDLRPLIDSTVYDSTVATCYQTNPREHHALVDARAYRLGWLAWMENRKSIGLALRQQALRQSAVNSRMSCLRLT